MDLSQIPKGSRRPASMLLVAVVVLAFIILNYYRTALAGAGMIATMVELSHHWATPWVLLAVMVVLILTAWYDWVRPTVDERIARLTEDLKTKEAEWGEDRKSAASELTKCRHELEGCKGDASGLEKACKGFKDEAERLRRQWHLEDVWHAAHRLTPKNLSIRIRYPDSTMRHLAEAFENALRAAASSHTVCPWKIWPLENTSGQLLNPSDRSRVVLFSNDEKRQQLATAISSALGLSDETKVWTWDAHDEQRADVELVIFDHKKRPD